MTCSKSGSSYTFHPALAGGMWAQCCRQSEKNVWHSGPSASRGHYSDELIATINSWWTQNVSISMQRSGSFSWVTLRLNLKTQWSCFTHIISFYFCRRASPFYSFTLHHILLTTGLFTRYRKSQAPNWLSLPMHLLGLSSAANSHFSRLICASLLKSV